MELNKISDKIVVTMDEASQKAEEKAPTEPLHIVFPELTITGADAGDYFFRMITHKLTPA